ncbi:MAG TPA: hypothetical protein VH933_08105 [Aestuariivirgaceae bacterium]|jgi:hypothetical protein
MIGPISRLCSLTLALTAVGGSWAGQLSHFPSPYESWTTSDYVDFYFAHFNGNRALPHLRTDETRKLFRRIVNRENVLRIMHGPATERRKQLDIAMILATMGEIRAAYGYAVFVGEPLQEELTHIQSFILYLIDSAVTLGADTDDGPGGRSAWKTAVWNVVGSLSERSNYSSEQIAFLSNALKVHYPEISVIFSERDKRQLRARIGSIAAAEPNAEAQIAHLQLLLTAMKY